MDQLRGPGNDGLRRPGRDRGQGRPSRRAQVILIDGDGSFQMTLQELATARTEGMPVIFTVLNNGVLGMVRQWQELFYDRPVLTDHSSTSTSPTW